MLDDSKEREKRARFNALRIELGRLYLTIPFNADAVATCTRELKKMVSVKLGRDHSGALIKPTDDQIMTVAKAACEITGALMEDLLQPPKRQGAAKYKPTTKARVYTALALNELFPRNNSLIASKLMVIAPSSIKSYITAYRNLLKHGRLPWWNDDAFMYVCKSLNRIERVKEPLA